MIKNLTILGATGSIGRSTLAVVARFPQRYAVTALTAGRNVEVLAQQIRQFRPRLAAVLDITARDALHKLLPGDTRTELLHGEEGFQAAASHPEVQMVVTGVVGAAGLVPTLAAIEAGKDIALANKETLVMAGAIVMARAAATGVAILPVDSEHSAIFQCIGEHPHREIKRLYLTASGGPFRQLPAAAFEEVRPEDALRHPNWQMGPKITIDSATLMNKGLEFIEANHLFGVAAEHIEVLIHPQSIVHSMVAFVDGAVLAQMGVPDMQGPIAYALSYPQRLPLGLPLPDFTGIAHLTFEPPDLKRFPCLRLAYEASAAGGTLPAVLNAANEIAVQAFLAGRIAFSGIAATVADTMNRHGVITTPDIGQIREADLWARGAAQQTVDRAS